MKALAIGKMTTASVVTYEDATGARYPKTVIRGSLDPSTIAGKQWGSLLTLIALFRRYSFANIF